MAVAELFWVDAELDGKLAVAPRPRGGDWLEEEIQSWKSAGIDVVVCLLDDGEIAELMLTDEAEFCRKHGIEFLRFPIPDRGVPSSVMRMQEFVRELTLHLKQRRNLLVHCRAGIGRTGLVAACCLIACGVDDGLAFAMIGRARGMVVPDTDEQRHWVDHFAAANRGPRH